jgi:glucose-1-phosphate thymidylyltransferase
VTVVGVVPAAGRAERLGSLPCSKEVLPVGIREGQVETGAGRLLRQLASAGAGRAFIVLGDEKWDIARYLADGQGLGIDVAYLAMRESPSTPATVDRAFGFVREATVVFGFPDILLRPDNAFVRLTGRLAETSADAVLGLFPAERPEEVDMVATDPDGRVRRIEIKPGRTELAHAWVAAAWAPVFSAYVHDFIAAGRGDDRRSELYVGDVLQAAIDDGLHVDSVTFPDGDFSDIGTPEGLLSALQQVW